jgi:hypothetical protein
MSNCKLCDSEDLSESVYHLRCNVCKWDSKHEYVYMLIPCFPEVEWEDMIIIVNKEDAITISKKYSIHTVQIYEKKTNMIGFEPMYNYFLNGEFIINQ